MRLAQGLHSQGKVKDIYQAGDRALLLVATDRISAFDAVLPTAIPGKGQVPNRPAKTMSEPAIHF